MMHLFLGLRRGPICEGGAVAAAPEHVEARDLPGVLGRVTLRVVEVDVLVTEGGSTTVAKPDIVASACIDVAQAFLRAVEEPGACSGGIEA